MSRISSHSSSRGISRTKFCEPPHARCASSASISHISSNRPSVWSFMNRISHIAGAGAAGRGTSRTRGGAAKIPDPTEVLTSPPKSSAMIWRARVRKLSTPVQRLSRRNNLLTIGSICSVISPDCIHNVDNPQAPTWLRPRSQASGLAPPALAGSGQGEAGEMIRIGGRSGEGRVGEEGRIRGSPDHLKKKKGKSGEADADKKQNGYTRLCRYTTPCMHV